MGNRAVITTKENFENNGVGVYLHWNGGRDSVEAFLTYCKLKGYRSPSNDYGWARLCQVIGNYFGGTMSLGIDVVSRLDCDNWDNGVYIIKDWDIVDRKFFEGAEQDGYELQAMLKEIDERMPAHDQLGKNFFEAPLVKTSDLKFGDFVYVYNDIYGRYEIFKVVGLGKPGDYQNGCKVGNVPYVNHYPRTNDFTGEVEYNQNVNNYLFDDEYRVAIASIEA